MSSIVHYRKDLAKRVVRAIKERNDGKRPKTRKQLDRCFSQWGVRLRWVPADVLREPFIRNGVVLIPDRRYDRTAQHVLRRWLAHELAEVVMAAECHREYAGPGWPDDRHRVARLVEQLLTAARN